MVGHAVEELVDGPPQRERRPGEGRPEHAQRVPLVLIPGRSRVGGCEKGRYMDAGRGSLRDNEHDEDPSRSRGWVDTAKQHDPRFRLVTDSRGGIGSCLCGWHPVGQPESVEHVAGRPGGALHGVQTRIERPATVRVDVVGQRRHYEVLHDDAAPCGFRPNSRDKAGWRTTAEQRRQECRCAEQRCGGRSEGDRGVRTRRLRRALA
jgi:hypothetical protein